MPVLPEKQPKPYLAQWMFDRNIKNPQMGELIDVSPAQVGRYCLPFADPKRQVPRKHLLARIAEATSGEVPPESFYDPGFRPREPRSPEAAQLEGAA